MYDTPVRLLNTEERLEMMIHFLTTGTEDIQSRLTVIFSTHWRYIIREKILESCNSYIQDLYKKINGMIHAAHVENSGDWEKVFQSLDDKSCSAIAKNLVKLNTEIKEHHSNGFK